MIVGFCEVPNRVTLTARGRFNPAFQALPSWLQWTSAVRRSRGNGRTWQSVRTTSASGSARSGAAAPVTGDTKSRSACGPRGGGGAASSAFPSGLPLLQEAARVGFFLGSQHLKCEHGLEPQHRVTRADATKPKTASAANPTPVKQVALGGQPPPGSRTCRYVAGSPLTRPARMT